MQRKYSLILGNLGNTCDRFCHSYKANLPAMEMLKLAAGVPNISGVELIGNWDVTQGNAREMQAILSDLGLECVSILPDLFSDPIYQRGAFSSKDPNVRRRAIDHTRQICDIALELGCGTICIWPGQDGYDYLLSADYERERDWVRDSITELASSYTSLRFALEYKPKEPRTHSYLARVSDTLLLAQETGLPNVGICIDTGHAFVAGEVAAESVVLAARTGNRLHHMHLNDNFGTWDDDMIAGSIHSIAYIELFYWLDRCGYNGWISTDQYPYREDAIGAISESIHWLVKFDALQRDNKERIDRVVQAGNAVETSRFLRSVMLG